MDGKIYLLALAILLLIFFIVRSQKKNSLTNKKKTQLKSLYRRDAVFLCDAVDDLGKNIIQFYGEPFGTSARPNMKIFVPNGTQYTIKEVYTNDETPNKPDSEIPNGMTNTAIVIETSNFDWDSFRQSIKNEGVVALKLQQ